MTEDKMVGWHHRCNGHELRHTSGDGEEQGSLVCCSPWGHKELDMTEQTEKQQHEAPTSGSFSPFQFASHAE